MLYNPSPVGCNIVVAGATIQDYNEKLYYEQLEVYKNYGFSHVEFSHVFQLDEAAAKRLKQRAMELGITIWSVHSWHLNDLTSEALALYNNQQEHHAKIAGALGASVMVCHLPNVKNRHGDLQRSVTILTMVADHCRKYGVRLAIEVCEDGDVEHIMKVIDTLNRPDVGMNVDTGHVMWCSKIQPSKVIRLCGSRIISLHLQDNYGANDDHQMPGLGLIDWPAVIKALKDVGYKGPLIMEMGYSGKKHRSVPELRTYEKEKELVQGGAWLDWLWTTIK